MKKFIDSMSESKQVSARQQIAMRLAVLLLPGLILLTAGCEKDEPTAPREIAPVAVRVAPVTQRDLAQRIGYVGTVHSQREVKVLAQTAGAVLSLTREGESVREGQLVARITAPEIAARSSRMDAEVRRAKTERDFLCETYETDRKLGAAGAITSRQVDMSKKACDAATAALTAARAGSREVGATRGKSKEQAPFDGLVLQWLVEPGQNVMPGMPLLLLGNHDLEVRVQVAQRDLERGVREGIPVFVRVGGQVHRLEVSTVAPIATGPGRTSEVKLPVPRELVAALGHGASARVDFLVAETAGSMAVSQKALTRVDDTDAVFVIKDGLARVIPVTPGIQDGDMVAVEGEIAPGAWVAVSNLDLLRDGASVFAVRSTSEDGVRP